MRTKLVGGLSLIVAAARCVVRGFLVYTTDHLQDNIGFELSLEPRPKRIAPGLEPYDVERPTSR